jgi:trans-2,3-dihydro-3-hydroxyanthranilate isomerase
MKYRFFIVDVFTEGPFAGNQLAVLPAADGISAIGMQSIAREFNFSETAFAVAVRSTPATYRVRIFTPTTELQFAGHPTVGTACALVYGRYAGSEAELLLVEGVGCVPVRVSRSGNALSGTLTLRARSEQPAFALDPCGLAEVLSLTQSDVLEGFFASVGMPFCFVHLRDREPVDRARLDKPAWTRVLSTAWSPHVFLFSGTAVDGRSSTRGCSRRRWGSKKTPRAAPHARRLSARSPSGLALKATSFGFPSFKASRWAGEATSRRPHTSSTES